MILKLIKPLQLAGQGEPVTELHLREPTAGDLAAAAAATNGVEGDILLIAKITNQPPGLIRQLSATDYVKASAFLGGFTRRALQTGES
jgi:Phage tail assembly chaperone proteins, E, or 41 or 14